MQRARCHWHPRMSIPALLHEVIMGSHCPNSRTFYSQNKAQRALRNVIRILLRLWLLSFPVLFWFQRWTTETKIHRRRKLSNLWCYHEIRLADWILCASLLPVLAQHQKVLPCTPKYLLAGQASFLFLDYAPTEILVDNPEDAITRFFADYRKISDVRSRGP